MTRRTVLICLHLVMWFRLWSNFITPVLQTGTTALLVLVLWAGRLAGELRQDGWRRNWDWRRKSGNRWRRGSPKARRAAVVVFAAPGTRWGIVAPLPQLPPTAGVSGELVNSTWSLALHRHIDVPAGWWPVCGRCVLAFGTLRSPFLQTKQK